MGREGTFFNIVINNNKLQWNTLNNIYSTANNGVENRLKKGKYTLQESAGLKSQTLR